MSNTRPSSIFPSLPGDTRISDKEGDMTSNWAILFENLTRALQTNFKSQGFVIPSVDAATFATLLPAATHNNLVYNSTTNELKFNQNGTWKTVQLL